MNQRSCLIFFCLILFPFSSVSAQSKPPLKVGAILPMTGDFSFFGEQARLGVMRAVEEINRAHPERQVELLIEDEKCLPKDAVNAFTKLVQIDKVDLVLGPVCTGAIMAVAPLTLRMHHEILALLDSGDEVASAGPHVFSLGFGTEDGAHLVAEHAARQGYKKIGVIYETDHWAVLVKDAFIKRFTELGGKITSEETQNVTDKDYRPNILKVMNQHPDAIYFAPAYNGGLALKQLRELKINLPALGPDTFGVNEVIETAGPAADGVVFANAEVNENSVAAKALRAYVGKNLNKQPHSLLYPALGYDGMQVLYRAGISSQPFAQTLRTLKYNGIIEIHGFKNRMSKLPPLLMTIRNGKIEPL